MSVSETLKKHGQEHLLRYYDELSSEEQRELLRQIGEIDWDILKSLTEDGAPRGEVSPIEGLTLAQIAARKGQYEEVGKRTVKAGKVAAV